MAFEELSEDELAARSRVMGQVISRAWTDEDYKARFVADPVGVMAEAGIETPAGMDFRVVENTDSVVHIILPPAPAEEVELSDEALEVVAGGSTAGTASSIATASSVGCPVGTLGCLSSGGCAGSA
jgi:hypothetical protein